MVKKISLYFIVNVNCHDTIFSFGGKGDDYENVCKQGFFRKSPPVHLFTNQTSWKKRYFILSKSIKNGYVLRYFKEQQLKGCIEINETSKIEIGIADCEKMAMVRKMFKCVPTEVMTIRTGSRDFYLIGTDSGHIYLKGSMSFISSLFCWENQFLLHIYGLVSKRRRILWIVHFNSPLHIPLDEQSGEDYEKENYYASPRSIQAQVIPVFFTMVIQFLHAFSVCRTMYTQVFWDFRSLQPPYQTISCWFMVVVVLSLVHYSVSQWSDPHHLGCIFHQGDCIVAVNDMHVKNMDDISLFTSRSTRKENVTSPRSPSGSSWPNRDFNPGFQSCSSTLKPLQLGIISKA
uniref:Pleckstrin homology domain containing S1 n=1 Tax=Anolis carolinensis TaxID=28377 RepID=A0A803TC06_ANOCA